MFSRVFAHPKINHGQETTLLYPNSHTEVNMQMEEILHNEVYKEGIKEDGVYWDVGANIGLSVLYFQPYAKMIYAMEPNPEIYKALVSNVGHFPNVKTFNLGLAHTSGKMEMFNEEGGSLPQTLFPQKPESSIGVDCVDAERFFKTNKIGHIDTMKIDVEAAEYIIFPSHSFAAVSPKIDVIIGEAHLTATGGFPEVIPLILEEYGYKTVYPKLKGHNYKKQFTVTDRATSLDKKYIYEFDTIFVAKR